MKKFAVVVFIGLFMLLTLSVSDVKAYYSVRVRGYYRSNGTYVMPHYRTSPDRYRYNNYSSYGNYNPYTGRVGYKRWY